MAGFDVQGYELDAAAGIADESGSALRAELGRLAGDVEDLLSAAWQGAAASGFAIAWQDWESGARTVLDALGSMAGSLRASSSSYGGAEAASELAS